MTTKSFAYKPSFSCCKRSWCSCAMSSGNWYSDMSGTWTCIWTSCSQTPLGALQTQQAISSKPNTMLLMWGLNSLLKEICSAANCNSKGTSWKTSCSLSSVAFAPVALISAVLFGGLATKSSQLLTWLSSCGALVSTSMVQLYCNMRRGWHGQSKCVPLEYIIMDTWFHLFKHFVISFVDLQSISETRKSCEIANSNNIQKKQFQCESLSFLLLMHWHIDSWRFCHMANQAMISSILGATRSQFMQVVTASITISTVQSPWYWIIPSSIEANFPWCFQATQASFLRVTSTALTCTVSLPCLAASSINKVVALWPLAITTVTTWNFCATAMDRNMALALLEPLWTVLLMPNRAVVLM